jgi:hypothetical protein
MTTRATMIACMCAQKLFQARASMRRKHRHQNNIGEIRITCTRATFAFHVARKNFLEHARNFFVRAIAKRAVAHPNIFSQAGVFGRSRHTESIKNERISAK